MPKTYYVILGITPWANEIDIRRAYRDLSKLYHPDTTQLPKDIAVENFRQINEAYATLSNADRRSEYDRRIQFSRFQFASPSDNGVRSQSELQDKTPKNIQTNDNDGLPSERPLSGGELFALSLIGATLIACIFLVVLVAWLRGDSFFPEAIAPLSIIYLDFTQHFPDLS